jgi:hypothetical protein
MGNYPGINVLEIPIRKGVAVAIHPLPYDLTKAEAEKLARVVMAYAQPE